MKPQRGRAEPLSLKPWRSVAGEFLLLAAFAGLLGRAVWLQVLNDDFLQEQGAQRASRVLEVPAHRGRVLDRNGEPLAVSTPVESVWASPADVEADAAQLRRLAAALQMKPADLQRRLDERSREFVYLKRQLPPDEARRVAELGVPGVFLQREYRRYYPAGEAAAHLVGLTDVDDRGQEGIELAYERRLAGVPGSRRVIRDRLGRIVEDVASLREPRPGGDLMLSIDQRVQYLAFRELKAAVEREKARSGAIVVMDSASGEVLAVANYPSFNPNNRATATPARTRNRAVTDLFEPGSTIKPFTVLAALESGAFRPETRINTASFTIGAATVRDVHRFDALSVAEVVQKSSNVGAAKMALALPREDLWETLAEVGFGEPPGSGFPGEAQGRLRPHRTWRPIEHATLSYGHGLSVNLLQLARAYTVFANDGVLAPVSLMKRDAPAEGTRVTTREMARDVRRMLELVTRPGGTAPLAQVRGFRVAGKTGTAHKLEGGHYAEDRYVSSFVGLAPASAPRLVVAVMVDEPRAGQHYGGQVAAPVFSRVAEEALRLLGVPGDAPVDNVVLPGAGAQQIREDV